MGSTDNNTRVREPVLRLSLLRLRSRTASIPLLLLIFLLNAGCGPRLQKAILPTEVTLLRYHQKEFLSSLEEFTKRLYAKNPRYELDLDLRQRKIDQIFHGCSPFDDRYRNTPSHELLSQTFAPNFIGDRVYTLALGLTKSVREVYGITEKRGFLVGLQMPVERLKKLHHNLSHANWRMKISRDQEGQLLLLTNDMGDENYLNMGYEVIMISILTRIEDDIYLRGGLPDRYSYTASRLFVSLLL